MPELRSRLLISLDPVGHWHVLVPKTLRFRVVEAASGNAVTGLRLTAQIAHGGERGFDPPIELSTVDRGDGTYTAEYVPETIGPYAIQAHLRRNGRRVSSPANACDVVRDGDEGVRVKARGTEYVYQIRYNWEPGVVKADDTVKAKLVFELMRGIPEGDQIQWERPWLNAFNHVNDAKEPLVSVEAVDNSVSETVHPVYRGMGVHQAERAFGAAEVGGGKEYDVRFSFTDPYNGARVTHQIPYRLRAIPASTGTGAIGGDTPHHHH